MNDNEKQLKDIVADMASVFNKKINLYGASFRVMRIHSCIEQLQYKLASLRTFELTDNTIDSDIEIVSAIFNYSIISIIQLESGTIDDSTECDIDEEMHVYESVCNCILNTISEKDKQYGSTWLKMNKRTFTDIMLTKIMRVKYCSMKGYDSAYDVAKDAFIDIAAYSLFYKYKIVNTEKTTN